MTSVAITCSRVLRGEQRVDAVAGTDVQRARDRAPRRQRREPRRRRRVRRDELRRVVGAARKAVERHQEPFRGHEPAARNERRAVDRGESQRQQCVDPFLRERLDCGGQLDRQLQEKESSAVASGEPSPRSRRSWTGTSAASVESALVAEQVVDRLFAVVDAAQGGAQPGGGTAVGDGLEAFAAHIGPRD